MLADGHARNLAYQGFGHSANLRVVRRHSGQRAAIATNDYRTIPFLEFGEATQLIEHLNRRLEPRVRESSLEQIAEGGFAEYFEPFTGEPLGSREQSWTAAVALDWLAHGPRREMRAA
jgi:hypothetical protein